MEFIQVIEKLPSENEIVLFQTRWTRETLRGYYDGENFVSKNRHWNCYLDVESWRYDDGM